MTIRLFLIALLMAAAPAQAGRVDATAVGSDDGLRIEAHLVRDTITSGATIGFTYDVNLTPEPIAIATKLCSATYDADSRTVTVSIGSEIPDAKSAARLTIVPSGSRKTFSAGVAPHFPVVTMPRFVQIGSTSCEAGACSLRRSPTSCTTSGWSGMPPFRSTRCRCVTSDRSRQTPRRFAEEP